MVRLNITSAWDPTTTPIITTATVKEFLRVTHTSDDSLIATMVTAAAEICQNYTNTQFIEQTYTMTMESWDDVYVSNSNKGYLYRDVSTNLNTYGGYYSQYTGLPQIVLPNPPLREIVHLKYYDTDNSQQTWSSDNYWAGTWKNQKGFIEIQKGVSQPSLYKRADAIEIQFKCGYGTAASDVPEAIKQAILLVVGKMYELREDSVSRLPKASEYILDPYRIKTY